MQERKEEALILGQEEHGDTSRRLMALARETGVVALMQRGGRQPRRGAAAGGGLDSFATAELRFAMPRSGTMATLLDAHVMDARMPLRENVTLVAMGSLLCEILRGLDLEGEAETHAVYDAATAMLDGWVSLASAMRVPGTEAAWEAATLLGVGWLTLLDVLGVAPQWDRCALTGERLAPARAAELCGVVSVVAGGRVGRTGAQRALEHLRPISPESEVTVQAWLERQDATAALAEVLRASAEREAAAGPADLAATTEDVLNEEPAAQLSELRLPIDVLEGAFNFLAVWTRQHLGMRLRSYSFLAGRLFAGKHRPEK